MNGIFRLFCDTSVFGGYFDGEFSEDTRRLFDYATAGKIIIVISDVILNEFERAPAEVRKLLHEYKDFIEIISVDTQEYALAEKYIMSGILPKKWSDDALHVATATIAEVDAIVSWNFKHMVRVDKIRAFNQVNFTNGYGMLTIISPKEVELSEE